MPRFTGLLVASWILILAGVVFYLTSVAGILFGGKSQPSDLGVYAVTVILVLFGLGALLLRRTKLNQPARP